MSLIAFGGGKGSPGVTTAVLALAAAWPAPPVVAECDPAGGDLVYRVRERAGTPLRREPGVISLAAATRHGATLPSAPGRVEDYCQTVASGINVVRGPVSPEQAAGLEPYWTAIGRFLAQASATVLADLGRLQPGNAAVPLARVADLVVLVCRDTVEGLAHLRDRCEYLPTALGRPPPLLAVVVVADPRSGHGERAVRHATEIVAHVGVPATVAGWLAVDPRAVSAIAAGGRPARSPLFRTARTLTTRLLALLPETPANTTVGVTAQEVQR